MLRRHLLRLLGSAPLLRFTRGATGLAAMPDEAPNAADVYRRVIAWSEDFPRPEWSAVREAPEAATLPAQVDRWLEAARPALAALREGARIDACHWGDEAMTAENLTRDRFNGAHRHLVSLASLSTIRHAESGRFEDALDDAFAALAFARRIGEDGPMIARLFQCAEEIVIRRALGRILPLLDRPALDSLARRLDAEPPAAPASAMIGPERRFILNCLRGHLATMGEALSDEDWERLQLVDEAPALKRLTGGERAKLIAHLDASAPAFEELGRRLDLPRGERDAALDDFVATRRETDPVAAMLVEPVRAMPNAVARADLLGRMLRAGLVLVRDGEAAFGTLRDPFGDGPFGLERRGEGWTIRSAFPDVKAPITEFRVGRPD